MASENENRRVLETILHDDVIFKKISDKVFSYIDIDNNGTIDREEIEEFVGKVCTYTKMERPSKAVISALFKELDTDASNTISQDELAVFLRGLYKAQLKVIKRKF